MGASDMRKLSFLDVASARTIGPAAVSEVSLARVWQHAQQVGDGSFGILTSWRSALPRAENQRRLGALEGAVRSAGLGFFKLQGHWQECQDPGVPYASCPSDKLVDTVEPSLFVPGADPGLLRRLGQKYDQDAWIYAGPETGGNVTLFFRDGGEQGLGKFHPHRVAQAYSQLKGGAPFTFESVAQGFFEGLVQLAAPSMDLRERAEAAVRDLRLFFRG